MKQLLFEFSINAGTKFNFKCSGTKSGTMIVYDERLVISLATSYGNRLHVIFGACTQWFATDFDHGITNENGLLKDFSVEMVFFLEMVRISLMFLAICARQSNTKLIPMLDYYENFWFLQLSEFLVLFDKCVFLCFFINVQLFQHSSFSIVFVTQSSGWIFVSTRDINIDLRWKHLDGWTKRSVVQSFIIMIVVEPNAFVNVSPRTFRHHMEVFRTL